MVVLHEMLKADRLSQEQVDAIVDEHQSQGKPIKAVSIEQYYFSEAEYLKTLAYILCTEIIDPESALPLPELKKSVPADLARMHQAMPVRQDAQSITLAVSEWPDPSVADDISFVSSRQVEYVVATQDSIEKAIQNLYGDENSSLSDLLSSVGNELTKSGKDNTIDLEDLNEATQSGPVIRFVNLVLYQAVKSRASDIHFEPFGQEFKIRYRVDGALCEMPPPPANLALPVISRVKIIAGLDIAETRLPQDGRIQLAVAGRPVDLRVSTLPTQFGESVVLRVLDRSNVQLNIDNIGFPEEIKNVFTEDIEKPNGIIIVTGPTGSGKTTTLYAALQRINRIETKILTAEDPVEYDIEGIIQLPIRDNIGLTFASALRSFLRQDPDIIMVGEIRDTETAQIAVQSSLTGHLVFSTLHTNDASGAVTRLIDMDIEPYLIASTLEAVMGQRLLRAVCPNCKSAYDPDDAELELLELSRNEIADRPFYRGTGCEACFHTGYSGRIAIFEYLQINDELRSLIIEKSPTVALRAKAMELGMRTLRQDGIRAILSGHTTIDEVVQYT